MKEVSARPTGAQECMLEPVARAERARGTYKGRGEPLEVDRQLLHRPRRPSARSAGSFCARWARVSSLSRRRSLSASWRARGEGAEGSEGEEAGRTRTHLLSRCSRARPSCSQRALHLLEFAEGRARVRKSPSVSREVGRRGWLMRTRRGRSGARARAHGGVGGAQRCWRVVQVGSRGPSRVPSREGEWTRSEEEH